MTTIRPTPEKGTNAGVGRDVTQRQYQKHFNLTSKDVKEHSYG